jgi:DNA-binding response OmpR family regulator
MEPDISSHNGSIRREARVLVVDDEAPLRRMIRRRLEAEEFQVEEAADGESALRLIQSRLEPFDVVLTDLSMPGIDGRQIQETLKRYRPTVAVLCMSADPEELPPIDPANAFIAVLRKPFNETELARAIRAELSRNRDVTAAAESEIVRAPQPVDLVAAARALRSTASPRNERRRSPRRRSYYTRVQLSELRISRVHSHGEYLFCLLSDGNIVRVPLGITPSLARAATGLGVRSWQLVSDGKAVVWYGGTLGATTERLSLTQILAHPDAQITVRPRASERATPSHPPRNT